MAALKGLTKDKAARDIPEILRAVELDDVPGRKIGALSGGMKQRLSLAQAVLGDPSILILDEPTAGLDPKQRIAIRNYISRIALDKIVLIATHVVSDIEFVAREIIMLRRGVIADRAAPHLLTSRIEGKVWHLPTSPDRVSELQARHRVTAIARDESGTDGRQVILRVLCEERPAENAIAVAPTLEDYYLYLFGENTAE
jgi:ABC-type multidrug transport system ATPase subunit